MGGNKMEVLKMPDGKVETIPSPMAARELHTGRSRNRYRVFYWKPFAAITSSTSAFRPASPMNWHRSYHESKFNPEAVSATNDYGLMQINEVNHDRLEEQYQCADTPMNWHRS